MRRMSQESLSRKNPHEAPGQRLLRLWNSACTKPLGKQLFSRVLGRMVPYSGSVKAVVEVLQPGYAKITVKDRRSIRNHLRSVHAVALINIGELVSGLAMLVGLPEGIRGIVTHLEADYHKKAKGNLTAECRTDIPAVGAEPVEYPVEAKIFNAAGEHVTTVRAVWHLSP